MSRPRKPEARTARITLRVTPAQLHAYQTAAARRDVHLSEVITRFLDVFAGAEIVHPIPENTKGNP